MRSALCGFLVVATLGCADQDVVPFLGNWQGGFQIAQMAPGSSAADRAAAEMRGFVQLYATKGRFRLRIENPQQAVDVNGTWEPKGRRAILRVGQLALSGMSAQELRAASLLTLSRSDVEAGLGREIVLELSGDGRELRGLDIRLGKATGALRFVKTGR